MIFASGCQLMSSPEDRQLRSWQERCQARGRGLTTRCHTPHPSHTDHALTPASPLPLTSPSPPSPLQHPPGGSKWSHSPPPVTTLHQPSQSPPPVTTLPQPTLSPLSDTPSHPPHTLPPPESVDPQSDPLQLHPQEGPHHHTPLGPSHTALHPSTAITPWTSPSHTPEDRPHPTAPGSGCPATHHNPAR